MHHDVVLRLGPIAADISTALVQLVARTLGRGPEHARTVIDEDLVVTFLHGGFTPAERLFVGEGRMDLVDAGRSVIQRVLEPEMRATVERLTGRRVVAVMAAHHGAPDLSVQTFVLDGPVLGVNAGRPRAPADGAARRGDPRAPRDAGR